MIPAEVSPPVPAPHPAAARQVAVAMVQGSSDAYLHMGSGVIV